MLHALLIKQAFPYMNKIDFTNKTTISDAFYHGTFSKLKSEDTFDSFFIRYVVPTKRDNFSALILSIIHNDLYSIYYISLNRDKFFYNVAYLSRPLKHFALNTIIISYHNRFEIGILQILERKYIAEEREGRLLIRKFFYIDIMR